MKELVLCLALSLAASVSAQEETTLDIGTRLELFVDDFLIDSLDEARLELHHPIPADVALHFDEPWEGRFCGYVTVLRDEDRFRMYYRGLPSAGKDGTSAETTCYAESEDGIRWTKPKLGLFEVDGTKDNNVVLAAYAPASHNFCPFLDRNPEAAPDARFKALGGASKGLFAFVSADGVRWTRLGDDPVLTQGAFDSQNVSFWSESEGCYVCYFRTWDRYRTVSRATSKDFVHWSEPAPMTYGDTPREHLYTNQTHPYFRAPHVYLSVAARFMPGRRVLSAEEARAVDVDPGYFGDCSDTIFMSSRGGTRYTRTFMEAFLRPGPGLENWTSRTNYPALGVLPTGEGELSIWVQRNYGQPTARLDRYTLRTDGFVSVHAPYGGGEMITKPLVFGPTCDEGLVLNFATSAAGSVRVEVRDPDGDVVPGFALEDCVELVGDFLDRPVTWTKGSDVRELAGRPIRLRFAMRDADLYSLRFR